MVSCCDKQTVASQHTVRLTSQALDYVTGWQINARSNDVIGRTRVDVPARVARWSNAILYKNTRIFCADNYYYLFHKL